MSRHALYSTAGWAVLRRRRLDLDAHTCVVPGCGERAVVVDHIDSRDVGKLVPVERLRSLCRLHDNQVKEDRAGKRKSGGRFTVPGCAADGTPLDPNHPWNRP